MNQRGRMFSFSDWVFVFCALIMGGCLLTFPFLNHNNRALFYFLQKKYETAEKEWLFALSENVFSSFYRMNLALNYMLMTEPEKAIQEYEVTRNLLERAELHGQFFTRGKNEKKNILSLKEGKQERGSTEDNLNKNNPKENIVFYSLFNSAVSASQVEKREDALDFYQQALSLRSNSYEVKTNIELLVQNQKNQQQEKEEETKNQKNQQQNKEEEAKNQKNKKSDDSGEKEGSSNKDKEKNQQREKEKRENAGKEKSQKNIEKENKKDRSEKPNKSTQGGENKREDKKKFPDRENSGQDKKGRNKTNEEPELSTTRESKGEGQLLNTQQTEAILKAILDQENQIRKRRQQSRKKPSNVEKDW